MTEIESIDIAGAITRATADVFSTMLGLEANAGQAGEVAADNDVARDGVVAVVGVAGQWSGTGRIRCSEQFACRIAGSMLGTEYPMVNDEVLDAVAEIANMIIGNVKTVFEERLGPLALSVPTVVFGRDYETHSAGVPHGAVVPFECRGDAMEVRFWLVEPSKQEPHRMWRTL